MAYSSCGLTNALYRGAKVSFVRNVNNLFMKYGFPIALFAAVRTFADGVHAVFTGIPMSLIQFTSRLFGKDKTMIRTASY